MSGVSYKVERVKIFVLLCGDGVSASAKERVCSCAGSAHGRVMLLLVASWEKRRIQRQVARNQNALHDVKQAKERK